MSIGTNVQSSLEVRLKKKCPALWSLLNQGAQHSLPPGIIEYLNKKNKKTVSWQALQKRESYIKDLINICGVKVVGDTYRRDLSKVDNENRLIDIFCEIIICASIAKLTSKIELRPRTGQRNRCDIYFQVEGVIVYGEVTRLRDNWWLDSNKPRARLISKTLTGEIPKNYIRPRSMDLYSTLIEKTRQLAEGNVNIFFIFTTSFGQESKYLQQALFGDINYFREPDDVVLANDGFFATPEGRVISACYLSSIESGKLVFRKAWKNPNTIAHIPTSVEDVLKKYDINNCK